MCNSEDSKHDESINFSKVEIEIGEGVTPCDICEHFNICCRSNVGPACIANGYDMFRRNND